MVFQHPDDHVGRQRDEDRIDEKEVERPEEKPDLPRGKAEARGTKGRDQRRSDRHARDHGRSAILPRLRHDTSQAAEQCDQHVVGRRHGACQQLAAVRRQGRHQKIGCRGDNRHDEHQRIIAQRLFEQFEIVDTQREADAHDRPHDGRNEHGADNYGGRIDIQSQRRHHRCANQDPQIDAAKLRTLADVSSYFILRGLVILQTETVPYKGPELRPKSERMTGLLFQFTIFHITHLLFFGFCIHILSKNFILNRFCNIRMLLQILFCSI